MKASIRAVDLDTGELVEGITMQDAEDRKRAKAFWDAQNAKALRRTNHRVLGNFYLSACRPGQFDGLKSQDITRLTYLASFLNYDNTLMLNERQRMTISDLPAVLSVSEATVRRLWSVVNARYIVQKPDGTLIMRYPFSRGKQKHSSERLTKFYINAVRKLYKATPTNKHSCLGRIFQLIEHINIEFNILSHNPEETDLSKVDPMTLKEFCEAAGYSVSKAHRLVSDLSSITFDVDGEQRHFIAFVTNKANPSADDRLIVINPRVVYDGHNFECVEAFALFFRE